MSTATADFAHTRHAETNRQRKANALAAAAANLGLQPYELKVIGSTAVEAEQRRRVRRTAGLDRDPSVETWMLALGYLEARAAGLPGARQCTACGAFVLQVVTEHDQRLLIDPYPHATGTVWPVAAPAGRRSGKSARVLAGHDERPDDQPLYRQHTASCPAAPPRPRSRSRAALCGECGLPLDQVLAERDPTYTTHPKCDPREEVRPP
ncbi:hypothetical protein N866_07100 [Actinotalea ferrariae CF5-4]|uniref:Uncharacterized protein n=1 Tax=Actinotalea ferrariae CF5-4 TaxID=948458 RepID=A0A021VTX2_9CELL|nr:hypothetical protein [Actinotalea ferrariae]EYR64644.1 hypothetical protein N866_07100 [Actinotalea ferrariae CF5-4]